VPELADGRGAEVWQEERVQMKLSDAKLVLETKYTRLNRLQRRWKPEAFTRTGIARIYTREGVGFPKC
jgi:hypothetical protein